MRLLIIVILLCSGIFLTAQTISLQVISSAGQTWDVDGQGSVSYTLGELAIGSYLVNDQMLTEGFHQPILSTTPAFYPAGFDFEMKVFPNPTPGLLNVKIKDLPRDIFLQLELINLLGVTQQTFSSMASGDYELDLRQLPAGMYLLRGTVDSQTIITYKIQKI